MLTKLVCSGKTDIVYHDLQWCTNTYCQSDRHRCTPNFVYIHTDLSHIGCSGPFDTFKTPPTDYYSIGSGYLRHKINHKHTTIHHQSIPTQTTEAGYEIAIGGDFFLSFFSNCHKKECTLIVMAGKRQIKIN